MLVSTLGLSTTHVTHSLTHVTHVTSLGGDGALELVPPEQQLREHGHASNRLWDRPTQLVLVQLDVTDLGRGQGWG